MARVRYNFFLNSRFKHHCGSNGVWDIEPGTKSCHIIRCPNPKYVWKHWSWICDDSLSPGSSCDGHCYKNVELKVTIECSENGLWKVELNHY